MSRQIKEDLEAITGRILFGESKESMTVGTTTPGELEGPTKKQGPKGSGSESTDADKAEEAPEDLQGATKDGKDSKGAKGKGGSKFEELYKQVVVEEEIDGGVEASSFDDEIGDFPAAGADEEAAEALDDGLGEETVKDLFAQAAEIFTKLGDLLGEDTLDDGEVISDETEIGEGEALAGEAVESSPAPDGVSKHTAKSSQNTKGVKVVKKAVSSASSGEENGGKTTNCPDTNLGPKTKLKANGSGAAVDGKDASAFE